MDDERVWLFPRQRSAEDARPAYRLQLLGGFQLLLRGTPLDLLPSGQRLIAYLAVTHRVLQRRHVAFALWLDTTEQRAMANLRSVVWRVNRAAPGLLGPAGPAIRLAPGCDVDLHELGAHCRGVLAGAEIEPSALLGPGTGELLPDWSEEWVLGERERVRQLRLHAMERLSERRLSEGELAWAVELALAVVVEDPLRESAHRCLIRAHLEQGNYVDAFRRYDIYRGQLYEQLGLPPSPLLEGLLDAVRNRCR